MDFHLTQKYQHGKKQNGSVTNYLYFLLLITWFISPVIVADDRTVDLRILVVSTGTPSEDPGLDLIDDVMQEIGIPYDVFDSRRETLQAEKLSTEDHGYYNGIIVTNSELFILNDPADPLAGAYSGFTPEEWEILHNYERNFSIRESVLSGFPTGFPDYGLEYSNGSASFNGTWLSPAGGTELFEYINTDNALPITDWAFSSRIKGTGPTVQPLLVNNGNLDEILVSRLNYPDGREVLFSSISNAWFLVHSQALAYEFINFASKGVFIGGRHVYFAAHIDDFFTADDLWNPETNTTEDSLTYRMSGLDLTNTLSAQNSINDRYTNLENFKLDFAFNGIGAQIPEDPDAPLLLPSVGDTYLEQNDRWDNTGNKSNGKIKYLSGASSEERMLIKFDTPTNATNLSSSAILILWADKPESSANTTSVNSSQDNDQLESENDRDRTSTRQFSSYYDRDDSDDSDDRDDHDDSDSSDDDDEEPGSPNNLNAKVCRVTADWNEGNGRNYRNATWMTRKTNVRWSNRGGDYDNNSCIEFSILVDGPVAVDITPIVNVWLSGQAANYGLIIMATSDGESIIFSREAETSMQPSLNIAFESSQSDSLTAAVLNLKDNFRFINHTYSHLNMDASMGTSYDDAKFEIEQNRVVWQQLALPDYNDNLRILVSGNHSGLKDENGTELIPEDDIQYPLGKNDAFLQAAYDSGVRHIASDSSQINQGVEGYIPEFDLVLSPRRPSALFYNVTTPEEWTDEYNYLFHERFIEQGLNPCDIPGAICTPRNYTEILAAEADWHIRQLLSYKVWPSFFHQSNLRDYDGQGSTLLFDWLDSLISRYEQIFNLPIKNLPYFEISDLTKDRIAVRNATINGVWNLEDNTVSLASDNEINAFITGVSGGELYGGQSIRKLTLNNTSQTFNVDRKLTE